MDIFTLKIDVVPPGSIRTIDGIDFEAAAFIFPEKDSSLAQIMSLNDALIVSDELRRSLIGNGRYLIFTNPSGIADDGGWDGVDVKYEGDIVHWTFFIGNEKLQLSFDSINYESEITRIFEELEKLPKDIELEPSQVVFPEDW